MIEAKLTSKGQVTIPIEIRRMLNLKAGDQLSFNINEHGIILEKSSRPLSIQERFANYDINESNKELTESMKEFDTGNDVGREDL
ncbi:AbrB/MazE/SpoVT family DNA-binding domain-containing protein [Virgibacillus sp. C22-A2]|uniref:AbrB/MazE/SpoVT family DNA-binding domain-containing protein n=1 Tax=Virgibacillus tibetensis TaxID=3042313 RepID=A0ABU6KK29_9BACI|nr:AbrB/MazE/SpoVT family DNA-binding domain-containing protein [Virgibacillus sp. C22-A2]